MKPCSRRRNRPPQNLLSYLAALLCTYGFFCVSSARAADKDVSSWKTPELSTVLVDVAESQHAVATGQISAGRPPTQRKSKSEFESLANAAAHLGLYGLAREYWDEVALSRTATEEDITRVAANKAMLYFGESNFEMAVQEAEKCQEYISYSPLRGQCLFVLGSSYHQLHEDEAAISNLRQAVEESVGEHKAEISLSLGRLLLEKRRLPQARDTLVEIPLDSAYAMEAMSLLLEIACDQDDYKEAVLWYREGIKIRQGAFRTAKNDYYSFVALLNTADRKSAEELFLDMSSRYPTSDAWMELSQSYSRSWQVKELLSGVLPRPTKRILDNSQEDSPS